VGNYKAYTTIWTKINKNTCYTFMTTFIASFHAWKKDGIATVAFFLLVSVFCMKWCMGHISKFGFIK
jgi:hypothetical protein